MHLDVADHNEVRRIMAFWAPGVPTFVFGSRVHGRGLKPTSDLDLCLKGDVPVNEKILRQVQDAFELSDLSVRVDVVDWHRLPAPFQHAISPDLTPL